MESESTGDPSPSEKPRAVPPPPSVSVQPSEPANGFLPTKMEDPDRFALIDKNLQAMSKCLNMKMNSLDSQAEFNFQSLNNVINPDFGAIVLQTEEWSATDLRTKSGEVRRIFIETPQNNSNDNPRRQLKYFSISADGQQTELTISEDLKLNPPESLISSLEADGELIGNSVSRRIYYENGDDLLLVERNGKIFSFELSHEGKTYSCSGMDATSTLACQCQ